jgi:hypothetical protein
MSDGRRVAHTAGTGLALERSKAPAAMRREVAGALLRQATDHPERDRRESLNVFMQYNGISEAQEAPPI